MANTGLINIDVNKTVDIVSNNGIDIQTLYGNVSIDSSDRLDLFSNNAMLVESDTSIDIVAPIIRLNGDSLILSGTNTSLSNTWTVIDERVQNLEANVYNANTGLLATRAYILTVEQAAANSTAALASRTDTLEAIVYDGNTGLAATRSYISTVEQAFANTTDALALSIESIVTTSGIGNKTYVQSEPPTQPPFNLVVGDLWFDANDSYKQYRWNGLTWIVVADQRIDGALAAVLDESRARANGESAVANSLQGIIVAVNNAQASVTLERNARVANDNALADQILILRSQVANTFSLIVEEANTRVTADEALAKTIETIVVGSGVAGARTYVQTTAPVNAGLGDLWFDSDDNFRMYRWNGTAWELVEDRRIANTLAAFTSERIARVANDNAMTLKVDGAISRIANSEAWINTVQRTSANSIESLATQVSQLVVTAGSNTGTITYFQTAAPVGAKAGDLWFDTDDGFRMYRYNNANTWINVSDARIANAISAISSESIARVANDSAMTLRVDSAFTRIANSEAWINTVQRTSANSIAALANQVTTISSTVYSSRTYTQATAPTNPIEGDLWFNTAANNRLYRYSPSTGWVEVSDQRVAAAQANISTIASTVATLNTAFSTLQTNVNARVGNVESFVTTQISALANTTSAQSLQVNNLSANVGRLSANVTTLSTAVANLASGATAQYVLRVNAGKVVGFTATSSGTQSDFVVQADTFRIVNSTGTGDIPFQVIGTNTYIKNAFIENLSIGTGKLSAGAVSDLETFTGYGGYVSSGGTTNVIVTPPVALDSVGYGKALINFYGVVDGSAYDDSAGYWTIYLDTGSGWVPYATTRFSFGVNNGAGRMRLPMSLATTIDGIQQVAVRVDVTSSYIGLYSAQRPFSTSDIFVTITGIKR